MSDNNNPLRIFCRNCGSPAGFNILKQSYACPHCGETSGIEDVRKSVYEWRSLQKDSTAEKISDQKLMICSCSTCGAEIVFGEGEASEICDFCGSKLIRREFNDPERLPELIIPFFITPDEAAERMKKWAREHSSTAEGKHLLSNMNRLRGYYLPYYVVRGPVRAEISRDGTFRRYQCAGYIDGVAVSASKQMDNLVLNCAEPFNWSEARPFEYGYIAGHRVKLCDISDANADERIRSEVRDDFRPEVERVMQTGGVNLSMSTGDMNVMPALMPMYVVKTKKLTAVMNGQTGRIAVSAGRSRKSYPWLVEPAVYTGVLTLVFGYFYDFDPEALFLGFCVFGAIIFAVMTQGKQAIKTDVILKTDARGVERNDGKLESGRDILKNPYDNTPVFYEKDESGQEIPVKIRFYGFARWFMFVFNSLVTIFLPVFPAALFRLASMGENERFMDYFHLSYGAAWYVLAAMIVLVYYVKGVRVDMYEHPIIHAMLPDGRLSLMGKAADRRVGILYMFGIGKKDSEGRTVTPFRLLSSMGGQGCFLAGGLLFLLLGSALAIGIDTGTDQMQN